MTFVLNKNMPRVFRMLRLKFPNWHCYDDDKTTAERNSGCIGIIRMNAYIDISFDFYLVVLTD